MTPSGTVTLLFTDVEGSTRLWEAERDAMAAALRRHDEILRDAIEQAGGYVFKTVGDAFCAAFSAARAGLDAALAAQRSLAAQSWPTSRPIAVRMGLHAGVCEERDGDYFGPAVNRAARMLAVARGGQVLVSGVAAELLSEEMPNGVGLRELGTHQLKDLSRPERIYQVEAEFLAAPAAEPALGAADVRDLLRIECGSGTAKRNGSWVVPRRLEINVGTGSVRLDFRQAVIAAPELRIDVRIGSGSLRLVTRPGIVVDAERRHSGQRQRQRGPAVQHGRSARPAGDDLRAGRRRRGLRSPRRPLAGVLAAVAAPTRES